MAFAAVMLVSCAKDKDRYEDRDAESLYSEAKGALNRGDYEKAKELYKALESRFPLGVYGQQSLLDLAYLYYKSEDAENAIETCDRFIKLYPQHPHVAYAYYLRGLASFYSGIGLVQRLFNVDQSQRDILNKVNSFYYFSELVDKYPESPYVADAKQRMVHMRNVLAEHEIAVAHYYLRRGAFIAAANRARYVLTHIPNNTSQPEALAVMARAYKVLGLNDLAADALRVFRLNYPNDPALAEVEALVIRDDSG